MPVAGSGAGFSTFAAKRAHDWSGPFGPLRNRCFAPLFNAHRQPRLAPPPHASAPNLRRSDDGERCRAHEPRQRLIARGHPDLAGEAGTGLAAEGDTDPGEGGEETVIAPGTGTDEGGEALAEGPPRTSAHNPQSAPPWEESGEINRKHSLARPKSM